MEYYRPTRAEINLDNLSANYAAIKRRVGDGVTVMPVIKANAYGHGALMCAAELIEKGAAYFAVSSIDEALQLRQAGINTPVLILGFAPPEALLELAQKNLTYAVYDLDFARALNEAGRASGIRQKAHVKLDTGMGRLGFLPDEAERAVRAVAAMPYVEAEGVFSHFADADAQDKTYAKRQLGIFNELLARLADLNIPYRHMANSGAVIDLPESRFNMVRPGISLYGMYPSDDCAGKDSLALRPVMELKTQIVQLKLLKKGEYLSYNRTFRAPRDTLVATLPVGYTDGYKRMLSNNCHVLIGDKAAPVIGLICMDQCMIDVTDIPDARLRDEVLLFGRDLPAAELARRAGTVHYEFVVCMGARVPRVFIKDGRPVCVDNWLLK